MELLEWIGMHGWSSFWLPVLIWTGPALAAWILAKQDILSASHRLDLVLATLLALPASVLAAWLPIGGLVSSRFPAFISLDWVSGPALTGPVATEVHQTVWWQSTSLIWVTVGGFTVAACILAIVAGVRLGRSMMQVNRMRRSARPVTDPERTALFSKQAGKVGMRRAIRFLEFEGLQTPISSGCISPVIITPRFTDHGLDLVLLHELQHHRRGDLWRAWAGGLIATAFAVHPLVHQLRSLLDELIEIDCDTSVLSCEGVSRRAYASLLMQYAHSSHPAGPSLRLASRPSQLKTRIEAMKSTSSSVVSLPVGLLLGLVLLLSVSLFSAMTGTTDDASNTHAPPPPPVSGMVPMELDDTVDIAPELVGGLPSLMDRIHYPDIARRAGVEGRVVAVVRVAVDGTPADITVVRGIGAGADEEAVRVLSQSRFTPGKKDGKAVLADVVVTVPFRLDGIADSPPPPAMDISMSTTGSTLDGQSMDIAALRIQIREHVKSGRSHVVLAIAPDVPVGEVTDLLSVLRSEGVSGIRFDAEGPSSRFISLLLPPPPPRNQ